MTLLRRWIMLSRPGILSRNQWKRKWGRAMVQRSQKNPNSSRSRALEGASTENLRHRLQPLQNPPLSRRAKGDQVSLHSRQPVRLSSGAVNCLLGSQYASGPSKFCLAKVARQEPFCLSEGCESAGMRRFRGGACSQLLWRSPVCKGCAWKKVTTAFH